MFDLEGRVAPVDRPVDWRNQVRVVNPPHANQNRTYVCPNVNLAVPVIIKGQVVPHPQLAPIREVGDGYLKYSHIIVAAGHVVVLNKALDDGLFVLNWEPEGLIPLRIQILLLHRALGLVVAHREVHEGVRAPALAEHILVHDLESPGLDEEENELVGSLLNVVVKAKLREGGAGIVNRDVDGREPCRIVDPLEGDEDVSNVGSHSPPVFSVVAEGVPSAVLCAVRQVGKGDLEASHEIVSAGHVVVVQPDGQSLTEPFLVLNLPRKMLLPHGV
mmetsp:Transcript_18303/g.37363  ORF Transcript_18303/g.37363 Transcript_18303/m.37363 type:complete len:274 (+) Transcript_18303:211-1032(+)